MIKKELSRNKKTSILFEEGEEVQCVQVAGLSEETMKWLSLKEWHKIRKVFSKTTEPILILDDIEGQESPKLDGRSYPFLSERFIKRPKDV